MVSQDVFRTFNQSFSCVAPMVLPIDLDFITGEVFEADLTPYIDLGYIDFISSVYVNLRVAGFDMIISPNTCNQEIVCKNDTINYMPIFLGSSPKFTANISAPLNGVFQIMVTNIPFFPFIQDVS